MKPAALILVLALAGLVDMTYATVLHYGWLQSASASSSFCSPTAGSCQAVFHTPQAKLMGVDLSVLGMVFYSFVAAAAGWKLARGRWPVQQLFVASIIGAAVFSVYLVYVLFFVIGQPCKLCLFAHAMNLLMAGVVIGTLKGQRRVERSAVLTPSA